MTEKEQGYQELGELFIEEQALEMIVYGALLEVKGIYTPDRVRGKGLWDSISRVQQGDGIYIDVGATNGGSATPDEGGEQEGIPSGATAVQPERRLQIHLSLVGQHGVPIHEAAEHAIENVRRKLKELAGAEADVIDVDIIGITKAP